MPPSFALTILGFEAATTNRVPSGRRASEVAPGWRISFDQLTLMVRKGYAVDVDGHDVYRPNIKNLANMSVTFVAGGQNQIISPETSALTLQWLLDAYPKGLFTRHVFPAYAHMDHFIGKQASVDDAANGVFKFVADTLAAKHATVTASDGT